MKRICIILFIQLFCFNIQSQTNSNPLSRKICLSTYDFVCNICTNDSISNEIFLINTFGLKKDGVGFLTFSFKFDNFNKNDTLIPKSIKLVRIFYRESLSAPYVLERDFLSDEEECFFQIVENQIINIFTNMKFYRFKEPDFDDYTCDVTAGNFVISVKFVNTDNKDNKK